MDESVAPLLAAFDAVASEGHVTRASELLGVPQSSVSRRLRALEKLLGFELTHPVGRGVALTPLGRQFFERTHGAVRALDEAVAAVRADADPESGIIRFGFPLTLGPHSITALINGFHDEAPRVRVHLVQAHGEALVDMLHNGRMDLAVVIPTPSDLPSTALGTQRLLVHVGRTHHLANRDSIDIEELVDESFVASPPTFHLRRVLEAWCSESGFAPRVPFEINEIETIRALVGSGTGIALLPATETASRDVVAIPLSGDRARDIALVSARHRPTAPVERFHRYILSNYSLNFPIQAD